MNPERWRRIEAVFHGALDRDEGGAREAYLDRECAGDAALRAEIEALLRSDSAKTSGIIDTPIAGVLAAAAAPRDDDAPAGLPDGTLVGPWRIRREIASGGMGTVYLASRADGEYEQEAAVKLIRRGRAGADLLERFRLERQTLARLSHPAIARLLDGGATADGRPYLVMEYVAGEPIDAYCAARRLGLDARLRLFRAVCAAVEHAHRNLVVHRDLKPSNILVTADGAPKLLDFGIAKVLSEEGEPGGAAPTRARLMTPEYASPEQVRGESVTTASDVWSLGVLLYELLTGRHPHREARATRTPYAIERAICEDEPERPSRAAEHGERISSDLDAIVLMALRKEKDRRYESVSRLSEDVGRYLEGLPVLARSGGAAYRARKFARRHRIAVGAVALLLLTLAGGVVAIAASARLARERLAEVLRLSDLTRLSGFLAEADDLWLDHPRAVPAMEDWIARARELGSRLDLHRATLADLVSRALPGAPEGGGAARFATAEENWQHELLTKLVAGLEALIAPGDGAIARVEERLALARGLARRSIEEPAAAWRATTEAIAASPLYRGLVLAPQMGLVPIGKDPRSGLFEFAHLASGEPARRDESTGELVLEEATGLVLVLLPGGTFVMGADRPSAERPAGAPNVDALAAPNESPASEVTLDPFFIAKHEMTQAEWRNVTKRNPSTYYPGYPDLPKRHTLRHPVENVSWNDCAWLLPRIGLLIPTEAQWEYAARGGTTTPWWTGADPRSLEGAANVADRSSLRAKTPWMTGLPPPLFDDGYPVHAPVESHRPNPFGLHGIIGNVAEWTRDALCFYRVPVRPGDGERVSDDERRLAHGGSFIHPPESARSTVRLVTSRDFKPATIGVRPSRRVDP